ncbi:hypothetical protein OS493_000487 [Desmophyllum pertusum]|uniref:Uncharacterized protein n=1 Tax=Desmophyllum pertusum TaxID=174260 RepID=A0A9X0A750_9CNID|nr:hypothetical protein OS493_000487 [Desmophyllum pertusum]
MKRTFVLLRWCDPLRVPRAPEMRSLQATGRVREIEFPNNVTSETVKEMLLNKFSNHLNADEASRLLFYKGVGTSNLLTHAGTMNDMCGQAMRRYRSTSKVYMRISPDGDNSGNSPPHSPNLNPRDQPYNQDLSDNAEQQTPEQMEGNDDFQSRRQQEDTLPQQGTGANMVIPVPSRGNRVQPPNTTDDAQQPTVADMVIPGPSRGNRVQPLNATGTNRTTHRQLARIAVSDSSDDEQDTRRGTMPFRSSTPNQTPNLPEDPHMIAVKIYEKMPYDKVIKVPMVACRCQHNGESSEVGEVEELPDLMIAAATDTGSGPAYDIGLLDNLLISRRIPQRLQILCLTAMEMRLQSSMDCSPVVIIRFRLNDNAAELLRALMMSDDIATLRSCHIHVALMGSKFDEEVCGIQSQADSSDLEIRILQPTMSSETLIVGGIVKGQDIQFLKNVWQAVAEACQAGQAVQAQRDLLQRNRDLRREQERQLRESVSIHVISQGMPQVKRSTRNAQALDIPLFRSASGQ